MPIFQKNQTNELKSYLSLSSIHDSFFTEIIYTKQAAVLTIDLFCPIENKSTEMIFSNVLVLFSINDNKWGKNETISSFTIEDDDSILDLFSIDDSDARDKCVHFVFQMFSGNEMHIWASELQIEIA